MVWVDGDNYEGGYEAVEVMIYEVAGALKMPIMSWHS